jgi:hypothetical protein
MPIVVDKAQWYSSLTSLFISIGNQHLNSVIYIFHFVFLALLIVKGVWGREKQGLDATPFRSSSFFSLFFSFSLLDFVVFLDFLAFLILLDS